MAELAQASVPSGASAGEKRLHKLLGRLPDDCIVYHEPAIQGRHPDFVVIAPRVGVLVIEVKGWYAAELRQVDGDSVHYERHGRTERERSPVKQVRDYLFRLMAEARSHQWSKCLLNTEGEFKGRFRFPFAPLVVLSNITRVALVKHRIEQPTWERLFPPERTLTRDRLPWLESLRGEMLLRALQTYLDPAWSFEPLNENEVNVLRAVIHPEILLGHGIRTSQEERDSRPCDEEREIIQVLDRRQERFAETLGDGHRIVYGVAGSGKTMLLVAHARRLAMTGLTKILVICYNRRLAVWLRSVLAEVKVVEVAHFHHWAGRRGVKWRWKESDDAYGRRLLADLEETNGTSSQDAYEAILVDEGQDFEPDWYRFLLRQMLDAQNGRLLIVADGCQSLYRRGRVSWSALGIRARGRTVSRAFELDRNYRNTREIVALAGSFASEPAAEDDDAIRNLRIQKVQCQRRCDCKPLLVECENRESELRWTHHAIAGLLEGEWNGERIGCHQAGEVGVLYAEANTDERVQLKEFCETLNRTGIPAHWVNRNAGARDEMASDAVRIQTIHSAKGLQFRTVIVLWTDKLPRLRLSREEQAADRRLLYVAMTRAESFLALTASKKSAHVEEIARSRAVELVPLPA